MNSINEFVWWFIRVGFGVGTDGYPKGEEGEEGYPNSIRLTHAGVRFVDAGEDHPALPKFLERVKARCPALPDGVVTLLEDARPCFDHGLFRPSVVLIGVAYELAIEHVVDALATKGLLTRKVADQTAAPRIIAIKTMLQADAIKAVLETDDRTAAIAAYDFADTLRLRRNAAAHTTPKHGFDDRQEIEEFLISASRHLPALWRLAVVSQ
jgi:hypothetical protein